MEGECIVADGKERGSRHVVGGGAVAAAAAKRKRNTYLVKDPSSWVEVMLQEECAHLARLAE
jgi:hypothetical protein